MDICGFGDLNIKGYGSLDAINIPLSGKIENKYSMGLALLKIVEIKRKVKDNKKIQILGNFNLFLILTKNASTTIEEIISKKQLILVPDRFIEWSK